MSYIKKIVISSFLSTAFFPAFLCAMQGDSAAAPQAYSQIQLAFQQALDAHDFDQAEMCLQQGVDLNANYVWVNDEISDRRRSNLLEHYAVYGTAEQVAFLLEHGANPFQYGVDGSHALCRSIHNKTENVLKIIRLLVEKVGANYPSKSLFKDSVLGEAADRIARGSLDISVVELLLQLGADPNHINGFGYAIFDSAVSYNKVKADPSYFTLLQLLYQYGANPHKHSLQKFLTPEQIVKLIGARNQMLAHRDHHYLECEYPYPSGDLACEDRHGQKLPTYRDLYNNELGTYLPLLLAPLVEICSDYSGNTLPGALLDPAYADAEAGEQRSSY